MLLDPFKINKITLPNRIIVAPMCQYSAKNGNPSQWHYGHLQQLAFSGAGMVMIESTAISDQGRITLRDLTLTNSDNENSFKEIVNYIKSLTDIPLGLQINHAGRKGSAHLPWDKPNLPLRAEEMGWETLAPSPIKRSSNWPTPRALTEVKLHEIVDEYKQAAIKANKIGFDCLEIHMAHGYLLHQFFSPISNLRKDSYGGSLQNRGRFLLDIIAEIREIWPSDKILGARITGKDWVKGGSTVKDGIWLAKKLKDNGLDYVCVSSGGIIPKTDLLFKEGYQVHLASEIKKATGLITRTAGLITGIDQASEILTNGSADLVAFGRKFINKPTWLMSKICERDGKQRVAPQYSRCY